MDNSCLYYYFECNIKVSLLMLNVLCVCDKFSCRISVLCLEIVFTAKFGLNGIISWSVSSDYCSAHSRSIFASISSTAYSASPSISRALFPVTSISPPNSYWCSSPPSISSSCCSAANSSDAVPMAARRYFWVCLWRNAVAFARLCSLTLATNGLRFFCASRKVDSAACCFSCYEALYSRVFLCSTSFSRLRVFRRLV